MEYLNSLNRSITGDLNFNFADPKSSTKAIKLFSSLNFMQVVESATRGNNILDPVFINTSDIHKISEVIVVDEGISDHMLVSFCYSATRERWKKERINYFDYRFTDWEGLTNFVVSECEKATTKSGCDEVLDLIIDIVKVGTEKFVPQKSILVNPTKCSFKLSPRTKRLMSIKKHYEMQSSGPQKGWFKMKLKVYTKRIAASMRKDFREMGDNLVRQHGVWKAMKKSNITFKKTCRLNPGVDAYEINKYYCEMGFPSHVTPYDTMSNYKTPECAIQFQVKPVSSADVLKAWKKMKKKTDSNPDVTGISKLFLNMLIQIPYFRDLIVEICNQSFSSGDVPVKCKLSRVIPIAKVENAINPDQYRPISLTPTILLLLERLYYDQLMEFIVENNVLTPYQFGFRKNHSTQLAMVALTDFVRGKVDSGLVCVIVSIDLRKAFDSVNRKKLLRKLARKFGISDHWLRSYLTERLQFVDVNGVFSAYLKSLAGVPAGSILGPILFSLFLNDLPESVKSDLTILFADDTNFVFVGKPSSIEALRKRIEASMEDLMSYLISNDLSLNADKTKMITVGSSAMQARLRGFSFMVNGFEIVRSDFLKCLGLYIDPTFQFDTHLTKITSACFIRLRTLYKVRQFFSKKSLVIIGNAVIMSLINYMIEIWGASSLKVLKRAERVVRALARLIYGLRKCDPVAGLINDDLGWLLPQQMCAYKSLCYFYKLSVREEVPYFTNFFPKNSDVHRYNTRGSSSFRSSQTCKSAFGAKMFSVRVTDLWNSLPSDIKDCSNIGIFKQKLKHHFLSS
ncbi:putative RNA-directed DNA polymerase from transposon BS [Orchesella cincta]|uniref:Putative RNA-directed DNA polymerase from transposon BS n=1 Tax=Orchesella cincta TaxID=48709 RepID=A0A1D2MAN3_ORCCI|nr:putative RNA-directed DNA polymerase from transposon BS [Orchesella cincta]